MEVLITMKYRANREQDVEDLKTLAKKKYDQINWKDLKDITNDFEFRRIKLMLNTLSKM